MNPITFKYDPSRQRLNQISTWNIYGTLTFTRPVSERDRIQIFLTTIRLLARRIKMPFADLRWVLKEEGDYANKLVHFHFLLDGSNMPNKDAATLAVNFAKLWKRAGGGDCKVGPYAIELDPEGFQKAVNYLTKIEAFDVPYSTFFDAGENCHLKFSEGLDKHLAKVCNVADQNQTERNDHE